MARIEDIEIKGQIVSMTTAEHKELGTVIAVASNYIDENGNIHGLVTLIPHNEATVPV